MTEQRKAPEPGSASSKPLYDALFNMFGLLIKEHEVWHIPFDGGYQIRLARSYPAQIGAEQMENVNAYLIGPDGEPRTYWDWKSRASDPASREWLERFFADQAREWLAHHDKRGDNA
jgi:hypothetical protein